MKSMIGVLAALLAEGTMSPDDSEVGRAEASLSGVTEEMTIQEEEVRIEDEVDDNYREEEVEEESTNPPPQAQ